MQALGITKAPAFKISGINIADEIRFNQMHNMCEFEISENAPIVKIQLQDNSQGFKTVSYADITVIERGGESTFKNELCRLITKYGDFGCPICTSDGTIIVSAGYAWAAKYCRRKTVDIYVASDEQVSLIKSFFSKEYGVFSYDEIERHTYVQGFAQMKRLRDGKKGVENSMRSTLYERHVLPYLKDKSGLRILDFGAGQYDYAKKVKNLGYDILMVDPYHRAKGSNSIDWQRNKKDFLKICKSIEENGLFDVVICDSVLNSVDSLEAENAVINTCHSLTKIGG